MENHDYTQRVDYLTYIQLIRHASLQNREPEPPMITTEWAAGEMESDPAALDAETIIIFEDESHVA